jgi:hypothetical protein
MRKEIHSAEEIRAEVYRRLSERRSAPFVPLPHHVERTRENLNANWDMPQDFRRQKGYQIEIGLALLAVKRHWDLDER